MFDKNYFVVELLRWGKCTKSSTTISVCIIIHLGLGWQVNNIRWGSAAGRPTRPPPAFLSSFTSTEFVLQIEFPSGWFRIGRELWRPHPWHSSDEGCRKIGLSLNTAKCEIVNDDMTTCGTLLVSLLGTQLLSLAGLPYRWRWVCVTAALRRKVEVLHRLGDRLQL